MKVNSGEELNSNLEKINVSFRDGDRAGKVEPINLCDHDTSNKYYFKETCENGNGHRHCLSSDIFFSNYLMTFNLNGLKELKIVSRGVVKLFFGTVLSENNFVENNKFNSKKLKAYIIESLVAEFAIVRNIPLGYQMNDIIIFAQI